CSSSPSAEYVFRSTSPRMRKARRVMDLIDIDSLKWAQYAGHARPWNAWIYRYEARTLATYERRIAAEYDEMLVVSEQEKSHFPGQSHAHLHAVPNGVDLKFFSPRKAASTASTPIIVFTGVMDYWPNVEGVKWFVDRVFPRVRAAVPAAQFLIVGSRPTPEVRRLENVDGVTVTGFVEDVREYLDRASVCVVPLRIARGIQNKLLEAMASGKAVVTTPQAFEGLSAEAGADLLVAADEEAFATATIRLLQDQAHAAAMGQRARLCMERHYSWHDNLMSLERLLQSASTQPRHAQALAR
ncbi:MAG: TIGR03087 family PEP-CTERM/XrtA system glycosyltransferase, partial [Steroidobacteraceae bacterium]